MGAVFQFPTTPKAGPTRSATTGEYSAIVVILPVIRVERHTPERCFTNGPHDTRRPRRRRRASSRT